jgi:hypothetical protein
MSNSLFSNNNDNSNNPPELSGEDALKLLVGDGAKYASAEELAKAMVHSQSHITTLEQEATTFKDTQAKQTSIDDILAAIKAGQSNTPKPDDDLKPADPPAPGSSEVDINKTVQEALALQTRNQQSVTNTELVTNALSEALGTRANEVYSKVGKDLGVDLDELSKTSPEAVIRLCTGQGQPNQQHSSLPPSTHTSGFGKPDTSVNGELNYQGIQDLYKKGGMSREKKFELEMNQALKLGDKFYNK